MRQKYMRGTFVHISKDLPETMKYYPRDSDAIVDATYSQKYGGPDIDNYSVYLLDGGKIINHISWYGVEHLSLLPTQDRDQAEEMIEEYNLGETT